MHVCALNMLIKFQAFFEMKFAEWRKSVEEVVGEKESGDHESVFVGWIHFSRHCLITLLAAHTHWKSHFRETIAQPIVRERRPGEMATIRLFISSTFEDTFNERCRTLFSLSRPPPSFLNLFTCRIINAHATAFLFMPPKKHTQRAADQKDSPCPQKKMSGPLAPHI